MHNDLLDILSRRELPITNEQLINYLTGKLSDEESHEIEKIIINSGVDNDAMEGLDMVRDKEKLQAYQIQINKALREKLSQKNTTRRRRRVWEFPWLLVLTGALLAFIILIWLIVHLLQTSN
jgi:hypothetical protein